VAAELATLCGVPAAAVEMAQRGNAPGSISRSLRAANTQMQVGALLVGEVDDRYVSRVGGKPTKNRLGHNLDNIAKVLNGKRPPPEFSGPAGFTAFDVFAGYLAFDAWIANRDRHEENWSVIQGPDQAPLRLAASYDHGSSFGFGLTDARRCQILNSPGGVENFAAKGTAWRFEDGKGQTLVELAGDALMRVAPDVRSHWRDRITDPKVNEWDDVLRRTPEMSDPARKLCSRLLEVNQRRLLHDIERCP
jgi:hypothetical protein